MSKYTTEIRWIVEQANFPADENLTIDQLIDNALPSIFNFEYPIWDVSYKAILEHKIILHYYLREIAFETVGVWKLFLNQTLNEIMPYYNQLYKTTTNNYNYLDYVDYLETYDKTFGEETENEFLNRSNGNSSTEATGQSNNKEIIAHRTIDHTYFKGKRTPELVTLSSDLPQTPITDADKYANNIKKDQGEEKTDNTTDDINTVDGTTTNTGSTASQGKTENNTENTGNNNQKKSSSESKRLHKRGNIGGKSKTELLIEYRKSLINIDRLVISELSNLFFTLY